MKTPLLPAFATCISLACASSLANASPQKTHDWKFTGEAYGLAAGVTTNTKAGTVSEADFEDIVDSVKLAGMGSLIAQKDLLSIFVNFNYINMEQGKQVRPNIRANAEIKTFFSTLGAGWQVWQQQDSNLNLIGAVRYLDLNAKLTTTTPLTTTKQVTDEHLFDGVVGIRGQNALSDQWYINYYADIGTGQSKMTWQTRAAINYDFNPWAVQIGYSYMAWQLDDPNFIEELTIHGPFAGFKYQF